MKKILITLACFSASTVSAETNEREELFLKLVVENGCTMTEDQADEILPKHDFTTNEVRPMVEALIESGRALLDEDEKHLKLLIEDCN